MGPDIWSSTLWYSAKGAAWWGINLGEELIITGRLLWAGNDLGVLGLMTHSARDQRGARFAFQLYTMSIRPTLLGIPDELFVKILSSLDFLQLVRSQLVRDFRHSSEIRPGLRHLYRCANISTTRLDQPENCSTSLNWAFVVSPMVHLTTHSTPLNGLITSSLGAWSGESLVSTRSLRYLPSPRNTCGNYVLQPSCESRTATLSFKVTSMS